MAGGDLIGCLELLDETAVALERELPSEEEGFVDGGEGE